MALVWLVLALLLVPGIATAQPPSAPPAAPLPPPPGPPSPSVPLQVPGMVIGVSPPGTFPVDVSTRTPPPSTIPSGPAVILPTAPPSEARPSRLFDFRPAVGVSGEYSDNFNRAEQNRQSNFRSMLSPSLQILFDSGYVTGSGSYTLGAFHDSSTSEHGFNHNLAGLLAWQVTPRLRLSLSEAFVETDEPGRADRLQINQGRQKFTSNQFSLTSDYSIATVDTKEFYRFSRFTSADTTTQSHTIGLSASASLGRSNVITGGYEYLSSETTSTGANAGGIGVAGAATSSTISGHQFTGTFSRDVSVLLTAGLTGSYALRDQTGITATSFSRWSVAFFSNYVLTDKLLVRSDIGIGQLITDSASGEPTLTSTSAISYWLGPATFTLGIERGFSETFGQGQNFGVVQTSGYSASVLYRFTPLLTSQLGGTYRENEFTGTGGGTAGTSNKAFTFTLNVSYQIARWLTASFDAIRTQNESSTGQAAVGAQGAQAGGGQGNFTENVFRASLNAILY